jgi:ABC-type transport system involved in multi-copper enzyme maturation permease subunit
MTTMTDAARPPRPVTHQPPGALSAAFRVFDLSLGEMLWSRRTIFMGLVVGLPVLLSVIVRLMTALNGPNMHVNNVAVNGPAMFGLMVWAFYLRFSVPVLGVFYGTSLIADEVEDKTITYLFSRPIPRGAVLLGKYFAYLACTVLVLLPSLMIVWFVVIPIGGSLGENFIDLVKDLGILALGLAVYGALFAFVGAWFKRPLLVGLVFVYGWELITLGVPGYMKRLTVAYYVQGLVPHAMPTNDVTALVQGIFRETPSLATSLLWLGVMEVVFLWLATRIVTRREYVLEQ